MSSQRLVYRKVVQTPAIPKPYSAIDTWVVSIGYDMEQRREYIFETYSSPAYFKGVMPMYTECIMAVYRTDALGQPQSFKLVPHSNKQLQISVSEFAEQAIEKEIVFEGNFSISIESQSLIEFIKRAVDELLADNKIRISPPSHWLVYSPSDELITRLIWVEKIEGKIEVRPYAKSNLAIVLASSKIQLSSIVTRRVTVREFRNWVEKKIRIDDIWKSILAKRVSEAQAAMEETISLAPSTPEQTVTETQTTTETASEFQAGTVE